MDLGHVDPLERRFASLYAAHSPAAVRLAFALTGDPSMAQDVVQEAFLRVFRRFADRKEPQDFERYLMATVVNHVRTSARRRKRERELLSQYAAGASAAEDDSGMSARLFTALLRLPVRQRAVVFLRYHMGLSEEEIASTLRCTVGAVKSMGVRARRTLKQEMEVERDD